VDQIEMNLRVTSLVVKRATEPDREVLEVRAQGAWHDYDGKYMLAYPASLHFTVYPGHEVIPIVGDEVVVSVKRRRPSVEELVSEYGGVSVTIKDGCVTDGRVVNEEPSQATDKRLNARAALIATGNGNDLTIEKDGTVAVTQ
jgi:hypothetical protein